MNNKNELMFEGRDKVVIAVLIFVLLQMCYGKMLFSTNVYQDFGAVVLNQGTTYNWLEIGRYGLVLLRYIFGTINQNVYYTAFLSSIFFVVTSMTFICIIEYLIKSNLNTITAVLFSLMLFVHPIWIEQIYFQFQSFEILFAIFLVATSLYLLFSADDLCLPNVICYLCSICFSVLAFGVYQSMLNIYITACAGFYLLSERRGSGWKNLFKDMFFHISFFMIDFLAYEIISHIFSQSDYIENQILWGQLPVKDVLLSIIVYIKNVFIGYGTFYTATYTIMLGLALLLWLVHTIIRYMQKEKLSNDFIDLMILLGLAITPFILGFITGKEPYIRSQLALPLATALLFIYNVKVVSLNFSRNRIYIVAVLGISFIALYSPLSTVLRLTYTYDIVAENSQYISCKLSYDIDKVLEESGNLPIAVVGNPSNIGCTSNSACVSPSDGMSDIFYPTYYQNYQYEPHYYWGTVWMTEYYKTYGISYSPASMEQVSEGVEVAREMPTWPAEGSIISRDGYILVKIGEIE